MKKILIVLLSMATVLINQSPENIACAANDFMSLDNSASGLKEDDEKFKSEFAYEMAKITAKIVVASPNNVEDFKALVAYANAIVTAKVMPLVLSEQKSQFAYEMAQITTKVISNQNLNIDEAKAEFAYEMAQLTSKIIINAHHSANDEKNMVNEQKTSLDLKPAVEEKYVGPDAVTLFRNNADIEKKTTNKVTNVPNAQPTVNGSPANISPQTYQYLVDDLKHVGDQSVRKDNKIKIDGEVRFHYAFNRGDSLWDKDSSGMRTYLGLGTDIDKDWRANGMFDIEKSFVNYNDKFELSRLNLVGKVGSSTVTLGSFSSLMAEGNIYDSGFKGASVTFGEPLKYTLSYGKTENSKNTVVATAKYTDFDYDLEAGAYHYKQDDGSSNKNTIRTFGGNYYFSNFSVGAMYLGATRKDSKGEKSGYVFNLNYGDFRTYRPGTYDIYAKYYNQPQWTYIQHGMNGLGGSMQGFRGYELGTHYTFAENLVGGLEYYNLKDKITGASGSTWWSEITRYF